MKNSRKMKKWGCVMLALMSGFVLPGIVQANSGLSDTPQTIGGENYYVGIKGASGNEVIIDSDLDAEAVGGYAYSDSVDVEAKDNSVAVNDGGVVSYISGGYAYSDQGDATANKNNVTVNGGTVEAELHGGLACSDQGDATANSNSVTMNGGTVGWIEGGYAVAYTDGTASSAPPGPGNSPRAP